MKNKFTLITLGSLVWMFASFSYAQDSSSLLKEEHLDQFFAGLSENNQEGLSAIRDFLQSMEDERSNSEKVSSILPLPWIFFSTSQAQATDLGKSKLDRNLKSLNQDLNHFREISKDISNGYEKTGSQKSEIETITRLAEEALSLTKKVKSFLAEIYSGRILVTSEEAKEVRKTALEIQQDLRRTSGQVLRKNQINAESGSLSKASLTEKEKVSPKIRKLSDYDKKLIEEFVADDFSKLDEVKILPMKELKASCFRAGYVLDQNSCKKLPSSFEWKNSLKVSCSSDKPILCNPRIFGLTTEQAGCKTSNANKQKQFIENNTCKFQPLCLSKEVVETSRACRQLSEKNPSTYWTARFFWKESSDAKQLKQMVRSLCYQPTSDRSHLERRSFQSIEKSFREVKDVKNPSGKAKSLVDSCMNIHRQVLALSHYRMGADPSSQKMLEPKDCSSKDDPCGKSKKSSEESKATT